jgi:AraC-like DNA-binding protein
MPDAPTPLPLSAHFITHPAGGGVPTHQHLSGQLTVVLGGTMRVTADQGWWLAPPGLAVWVPPQTPHAASYSETSSLINVNFPQQIAQRLPAECRTMAVSDLLRELAREAVRLDDGLARGAECAARSRGLIAELMVLQLIRPVAAPALFVPHGQDRRLRKAIAILHQEPGTDLSIEALAARVNSSERTLSRLFVTETGMTFRRWREHMRLVTSIDKLARGNTITATALELGYSSASSFTTLFTRVLGVPPRRYMSLMRERSDEAQS